MIQIVSLIGSVLILSAYAANQAGRLTTERVAYTVLNLVGSVVLTIVAIVEEQWGFLLLEGVWAVVSAWALFKPRRAVAPA